MFYSNSDLFQWGVIHNDITSHKVFSHPSEWKIVTVRHTFFASHYIKDEQSVIFFKAIPEKFYTLRLRRILTWSSLL